MVFASQFESPTGAQAEGWDAIAKGRHTLIAAPTGSGKTLAAFLTCIDRLVRAGLDGGLPERTEVVYVSPLKALSNDVQRNLSVPLEGISALAVAHGTPLPEIRVAVRTGDTPQRERTLMAKQPPHILITTPESLFILLTSESGQTRAAGRSHADPRRDPRRRRRQAGVAPEPLGRAAVPTVGRGSDAHRAVGDAAANRGGGAVPGGDGGGPSTGSGRTE